MRRYRTGFTLLEVLITISIMATAMGMAAPRIHQTLEREAVRGAKITLATHVARTRGVAASRGVASSLSGTNHHTPEDWWVRSCAGNKCEPGRSWSLQRPASANDHSNQPMEMDPPPSPQKQASIPE